MNRNERYQEVSNQEKRSILIDEKAKSLANGDESKHEGIIQQIKHREQRNKQFR